MTMARFCFVLLVTVVQVCSSYPFFHVPNDPARCSVRSLKTAAAAPTPETSYIPMNPAHPVVISLIALMSACFATMSAFLVYRRLRSPVPAGDAVTTADDDDEGLPQQIGYRDCMFGNVSWIAMIVFSASLQLSLVVIAIDFYAKVGIFASDLVTVFIVMWHIVSLWLLVINAAAPFISDLFRLPVPLSQATTVRLVSSRAVVPRGNTVAARLSDVMDRFARTYLGRATDAVDVPVMYTPRAATPYIEFRCLRLTFDEQTQKFATAVPAKFAEDHAPNVMEVPVATIMSATVTELSSLFYVYQLQIIWVWILFAYWKMALCAGILVVLSIAVKVHTVIAADSKVRDLACAQATARCIAFREGVWSEIGVRDLIPGDRVRLETDAIVPADLRLTRGEVVVDESMLTGESRPVRKFAVADGDTAGAHHTLSAGTTIIQLTDAADDDDASNDADADQFPVGLVIATGSKTFKGRLLRKIIFPSPVNIVFDMELSMVIGVLCVWGVIGGIGTITFLNGVSGTWFYAICTIGCTLSPMLPAMLVVGQAVAARRLAANDINCTQMSRIALAGKVSIACFDKTGTLTRAGLVFSGVQAIGDDGMLHDAPTEDVATVPALLQAALGTAHSLSELDDGRVIGNAVDLEMFKQSGFEMNGTHRDRTGPLTRLEVVKVFAFEHRLMRMSVIVRDLDSNTVHLFCKGSYETVANLASLPPHFERIAKGHSRDGCYTLALAHRVLQEDDVDLDRSALEKGMSAIGLIMFTNPLKSCTRDAIVQLQEAGGIRCVMITGDTALTGVTVARRCAMIAPQARVLLAACRGTPPCTDVVWTEARDGAPVTEDVLTLLATDPTIELAMTSRAFYALTAAGVMDLLLPRTKVFGRMKPDDKVACVKAHQGKDGARVVAMCGDGANDSAALRVAHVGLALSEADASIVAPFATGSGTIGSFVDLVRHGRGALATNLAAYRFMVLYGEILLFSKTMSAYFSVVMHETVWISLDVVVSMGLAVTLTRAEPSSMLTSGRPTARLLGPETLSATVGTIGINLVFLISIICWLFSSSGGGGWFLCHEWAGRSLSSMMDWRVLGDNVEAGVLALVTFAQVVIVAGASNLGGEFRAQWIRNRVFVASLTVFIGLWAFVLLGGDTVVSCFWHVNCVASDNLMPMSARIQLLLIILANAFVVWFLHYVVVFGWGRRVARQRWPLTKAEDITVKK